ncbi:MAG: asparagine synthase-related protein, partial [Vicinamibacterales bacterium]
GEFHRSDRLRRRLTEVGVRLDDTTSDPELALLALANLGPDFAGLVDGAFVIAAYDPVARAITLVNDRSGLYPTYVWHGGGRLVFAPEVKAVVAARCVPRTLDPTAVAQFVRFQHLLETRTFHVGIEQFPFASIGHFDLRSGRWTVRRYWDWDAIPQRDEVDFDEAVAESTRLLRDAVRRMSSGPLRPGVFLSGGLDSRTLLGFLAESVPAPVTATFGRRGCRDVHYAARLARAAASRHHWFDLPDGRWVLDWVDTHFALTEGFQSWIHLHGLSMLPVLRDHMDVNLSGWDGATVMGHAEVVNPLLNRPPTHAALLSPLFQAFVSTFTWPGLTEAEERQLYAPSQRPTMVGLAFESMAEAFAHYDRYRLEYRAEIFYVHNHCYRLTQNMVTFTRSHLEVRCPFFDPPLIDFNYSLRPDVRADQQVYRQVIATALPRFARIPYDKRERLPLRGRRHQLHALATRAARRLGLLPQRATLYADYEEYLRTDLRGWAEGILLDPQARVREFFDPPFLASLVQRHMDGTEQWTIGKIASLVTLEQVLREYFD